MFTSDADILAWLLRAGRRRAGLVFGVVCSRAGDCGRVGCARAGGLVAEVAGEAGSDSLAAGGFPAWWLWRGGEAGEGLASAFPGLGREPGGGAAVVVGLAGVEGGEDALVADGEQAGDPEREGGQAGQAAPAAGDAGGGGVLDGGERALGAGAPCVGAAVRRGRVVVFLPGLGRHGRRDGEGL